MQLNAEFKFNLNQKIIPGLVSAGRFSTGGSFLATALNGGKIMVTNLWAASKLVESENINDYNNILNINQTILALDTGNLNKFATDRDLILVGTESNILVYDVENNRDVFYKEIVDGVNAICVGTNPLESNTQSSDSVVMVGGHCNLAIYDYRGDELMWSVTGDTVTSLVTIDDIWGGSGKKLLMVVGSEDCELRVFRSDEIIQEITETEVVQILCPLGGSKFGYGLTNGTIGVYESMNRLWRIKRKSIPTTQTAFDINNEGMGHLVTGWSNGDLDIRKYENGGVLYKDSFKQPIAGVLEVTHPEYKSMLLVCTNEGLVRIYKMLPGSSSIDLSNAQDIIFDLSQQQQNLELTLKQYSAIKAQSQDPDSNYQSIIPNDTQVDCQMKIFPNETNPAVELMFKTNNDVLIRCVMVFAEGIFPGECYVVHPAINELANHLQVLISPPRDITVNLHIKIMLGYKHQNQLHIFEMIETLPKFSMYKLVTSSDGFIRPGSYVTFSVHERLQRFVLWINQNFLLDNELQLENKSQSDLSVRFIGLRQKQALDIFFDMKTDQVTIYTDNMELAANLVQSLVEYLKLTDLPSVCHFPMKFHTLNEVISEVTGIQAGRQRMTIDIADQSSLIKNLIVRAEDSRIIHNMSGVKKYFMDLQHLNRDLINRFQMRSSNHEALVKCMKYINQFIQTGANLRAGKYRTRLIQECRQAVKDNQLGLLDRLIKNGAN